MSDLQLRQGVRHQLGQQRMSDLQLLTGNGEMVRAIDAAALFAAAGITDVRETATLDLAVFTENTTELERIAKEARGQVSAELVRRRDADAVWTTREGAYTITCPSPEAGTTGYDADTLHAVLTAAVEEDAISQAAMDAAVKDVTPRPRLTFGQLRTIAAALNGELDIADEQRLLDDITDELKHEPAPVYAVQTAGVNRLVKIGGEIAYAVKRCQISRTPPPRTATVKRAPVVA